MVCPQVTAQAARPAFSLHQLRAGGQSLTPHMDLFLDEQARRSLADVRRASHRFQPPTEPTPSYGFTEMAVWVRFTVSNQEPVAREWLLEFGSTQTDYVDLYVPGEDGEYEHRRSGDRLPFVSRDLPYRNVVFHLVEPPGQRVYYLRVRTSGSLSVPLSAWSQLGFLDHLHVQLPMLWMFFGLLLVVSVHNLFVFLSVREVSYLYYGAYVLSYGFFQLVMNGLAFQYLWPNAPDFANRCLPPLIACALISGALFHREFLGLARHMPRFDLFVRYAIVGVGVPAMLISLFAPYAWGIRVTVFIGVGVVLIGLYSSSIMVWRRHRQAYFYASAWAFFLLGLLLFLLKTVGVLPSTWLTEWAAQIGSALEVVLLSLGLADRINIMRRDVEHLNTELSDNVLRLEETLERAEQARRVKSEFLATVSHELRTPLNTIINIPEGLLEQFEPWSTVECRTCRAVFELDPGEQFVDGSACLECGASELVASPRFRFRGDPTASVDYLRQVQRSGGHLLHVVNDLIDVSRLEAGRMSLHIAPIPMGPLMERTLGPLKMLALQRSISVELGPLPEPCVVQGDSTKISQVLINLISNAIKFSHVGGRVQVHTSVTDGAFIFSVVDHGMGIAKEHHAAVFDSFVQVTAGGQREFAGSGLGLAITKKLVELHQGSIWMESELGRGTAFHVRLPAATHVDAGRPALGTQSTAVAVGR